jgi:hypothetical protein
MNAIFKKLDEEEMKALIRFMKASEISMSAQPPMKLDLPPVGIELDGPGTYLNWSRWITCALGGKHLDGFLTRKEKEPVAGTTEWEEWKATHMLLYAWLLNSMVQSIAVTVDDIRAYMTSRSNYKGPMQGLRTTCVYFKSSER